MYNTSLLDGTETEVAVDFGAHSKRFFKSGLPLSAVTLILSTSALAANEPISPCEQVSRDLKSLDIQVETLIIDAVDHVPIDQKAIDPNALDANPRAGVSEAPIIYLTPRVTSILRDVFGAATADRSSETQEQNSSSPLADSEKTVESGVVSADEANESNELPHYQRQMYRTDI